MRNVTVLIDSSHKDLYLSENISVTPDSEISVKYATVFWDYSNVIRNVNDTFVHNGNTIRLPGGTWTFEMLSNIRDTYVVYNVTGKHYATIPGFYMARSATGGCSVYSDNISYTINLGKFGPLIGFDENTAISPRQQSLSRNPMDLNRGLEYVTVSCDIVDNERNVNTDGKRSYVIATLPVPRDIDMKRAITQYDYDDNRFVVRNGCYNKLSFDVSTNIGHVGVGSILLELTIDDK